MTWHPDMPHEYRNQIVTGDARVLAERIPDESVDLVLTDPPFGIGFDYSNGYKDDRNTYLEMIRWIVKESSRILSRGALAFVFVAQPQLRHVLPLFPESVRIFAACKNFVQMRPIPVQFAYDPVLFWQKSGDYSREHQGRDWHIGNTAVTMNRGLNEVTFHSCPRPLDTILYMVDNFSPIGGIVADFFMGSGTTALASTLTGRKFIGFEIDPATAELARERVRNTQPPLPLEMPVQDVLL